MTSAVKILLITTIASFLLTAGAEEGLIASLALWPLQAGFMPWQLVTYAFLHGNLMHLAFNMYGLWMFGTELENILGKRTFLKLYFASVLSAAAMQLLVNDISGNLVPTVGASGGVFGLLLAYGLLFPNRKLMLLFFPVPISAWVFVTIYAAIELTLGVTGVQMEVAHFAHIGGMIGGYLVIRQWRRQRRDRRWY
ncbi:MAG: rhomboid family intramembrane serine protease [Gallionellales bacterium 35-53-114]|jgi:membrane associated rhomboid family serine protease|nr:MAG: rhomboid family intramembrane serine protease [Gallionellales bacterium 35-53-114]OYZ62609.1 MAG: rhomboid family intramembrane serine protease [Gallionellales bacterium 24-53-125]OZB09683.1 MAG: rhomboid family intramembrane serine protease [Gallionellales bacterium 39-52-133]HQS57760.1 rhomboid family intramembrane serine protease [Gallionellaceae bacterium]HQS74213.1 rhomboid family intramembrane serine protease [Gallionellaceae bacterium]